MVFAVYEQGMRIQTPRQTLLGQQGVSALQKSHRTRRATDTDSDSSHLERLAEQPFIQFSKMVQQATDKSSDSEKKPSSDQAQKALSAYRSTVKANSPKITKVTAQLIMSTPVFSIGFDQSLQHGWQLMRQHKISHLILVNKRGALMGMVTDKDILKATSGVSHIDLSEHSPDEVMLSNLVSRKLITVNPEAELMELASVMLEQQLSALPVVTEQDELKGIITRTDLIQAVVSQHLEIWY
ncbi:CBS domain-containing protein [Oceanospirillum multiglobuliferum]|uniref:CBS domain-containing protein n=1 Tax=Oceanospirillum multiglobuliferum TaxID=64969 RepID=A0A1T4SGM3_9GAMM|nr:CBS domain-containing protein [Oceanospirillum multiglobuliferum]OPX54272.1 hypothetical protein BTE48_15170 [Oceanospirillum multiglobuliferum]SKA27306.1 CBS domain-containing protein [Oceanospirillum multiglobuliferum]